MPPSITTSRLLPKTRSPFDKTINRNKILSQKRYGIAVYLGAAFLKASRLPHHGRFARRGIGTSIVFAAAVAVIVVAILASAILILVPKSSSSGTKSASSSSSSNVGPTITSSPTNESTSAQNLAPMSASCITVVPYDSIQKQFGGCGYTLSVLFNGAPYAQTLSNGSVETNSGWTLLIEASQNCRCGPSENVTVGWDPAGPSTASGERLPVPASSTLLDGNLTIQWRLYGSAHPLLYAWIIAPTISASQQTTSTESTSTSCPTSSWPSGISTSYQSVVQQIEGNPAFVALTDGLCYSFTLNYSGESAGLGLATFVFNQYNGTIYYSCGTFPANLIVSQIQVTLFNGTTFNEVDSMWLENDTNQLNINEGCSPTAPPIFVQSVTLTPPYTPAGPTVEVTLRGGPGQSPITNLTAVLSLTGKNQTFQFSGVSPSSPLMAGQPASQTEVIVGPVSIDTNAIYPMTITGTFQNGQTFSYVVHVQIQNSPQ